MSKIKVPLSYIDCNSLNGIAIMLNHKGMPGSASVLLSIQKKIGQTLDILESIDTDQVVSNGKEK